MSLDVSIRAKREVEVYEANITYNLSKMYYKCIDKEQGLKRLNGMMCAQCIPILNDAIKDMIKNRKEYEELNPENGWGTYTGLLNTFQKMRDCCEENPDGIVEVD